MGRMLREADRHAERIMVMVQSGAHEQGNDAITRSWSRCLNEYRLHPDQPREPAVLERAALEGRRERRADVIDCARYEMTTLYQQLADPDSAVVLTDTDGVIIHMVSSPDFAADVAPLGLRAGGLWSEAEAGTNGMGTCIASAAPVSIRREDHFFTQFSQLTCSAVPVYDPSGAIAAVLDVTSRSSQMQQHLLVLLGMTARMIENRLIDQRFRNAHPLHFHSRPEFVYTLHEGKLAVGDDGRILAANRSALFQLGLQSMDDIRSRRVEDLFQSSLEDMLQRSLSSSFHPVVTYRANAALRFFAVARRPASAANSTVHPMSSTLASTAVASTAAAVLPAKAAVRPMVPRVMSSSSATFKDPRLVAHLETARRVIARQTPVLLWGETGSGKEVFARATHDASPHAHGAFVAVNCASLPETLIESELFGYRAGAFTGAQRTGRRGKILQADGGTLFLDEIADMPLDLQARLLRVLDERQVTPLGTEETHPVDFQLISGSHRNLPALVQEGRFREDLYYRLAGIELELPALRERSDKLELIRDMLRTEAGGDVTLSADAQRLLMDYPWPGNIRQLRHVLRSAAALSDGQQIGREHLPSMVVYPAHTAAPAVTVHAAAAAAPTADDDAPPPIKLNPIQANERQVLLQMLEQQRWNVSNVAKALDVSRNTLYRKLHKLHIEVSHPE
jgi:transcriptional regulator of acetoin/glycerol metabolism